MITMLKWFKFRTIPVFILIIFLFSCEGSKIHTQSGGRRLEGSILFIGLADIPVFQTFQQSGEIHRLTEIKQGVVYGPSAPPKGEISGGDLVALAHNHHLLHNVVQLPCVAGPRVLLQRVEGLAGEDFFVVVFFIVSGQEFFC